METLIPNIFVSDINKTIEFYNKLGFKVTMSVPQEGDFNWVMMTCGSVSIMFQTFKSLDNELPQISRDNGGSLLLYIKIKDVVAFFNKISNDVIVLKGLEKTFYGATEFSIIDLNGYILTFAENTN